MRLVHGMRKPANWLQLVRFGVVGGVGFVVNLAVYALFVHALGRRLPRRGGGAWIVAVLNNFVLNRHWTFDARGWPGACPGDALHPRQPRRVRLQPAAADAAGRGRRRRQGARPGARRGRRDAASTSSATSSGAFARRPPASPGRRAERAIRPVGRPSDGYLYSGLSPSRRTFRAGDGHLRRQLRHGRQAADRAPEDRRRQQVPADLDRSSGGRVDPDEAAGRGHAAADDPRPAVRHPRRARRQMHAGRRSPSCARTRSSRRSR